ncbi:hypothetical protein B0H17DRAFT_1139049 [Mycena rosella]|uniref:Uncharacterized protein n=1 Tax=Mycena rosella TaxID=1033263 RepID=A0AAD7D6M9_MYCRO|nr:hypothetical protein B0H17DRAFT_1139049 [Mycena rosella]
MLNLKLVFLLPSVLGSVVAAAQHVWTNVLPLVVPTTGNIAVVQNMAGDTCLFYQCPEVHSGNKVLYTMVNAAGGSGAWLRVGFWSAEAPTAVTEGYYVVGHLEKGDREKSATGTPRTQRNTVAATTWGLDNKREMDTHLSEDVLMRNMQLQRSENING